MSLSVQANCLLSVASTAPTPSAVWRCTTPPATSGGCWVAWHLHAAMRAWPSWEKPSTPWAASTGTSSSTRWRFTTSRRTSGTTAPRPCLPSLTEEGRDREVGGAAGAGGRGLSQCFTFFQTNRLSDVIVFRDVLCVCVCECVWADMCGWGGGLLWWGVFSEDWLISGGWVEGWGGLGWVGVVGLLPKATWRLCILHTMFFVLYIFCFFLIFCHMPTFNTHLVLFFFS